MLDTSLLTVETQRLHWAFWAKHRRTYRALLGLLPRLAPPGPDAVPPPSADA
jgi:hypothetical protein